MKKHPQEFGLAGGQGRESEDTRQAGELLFWCGLLLLAAVCVLVLGGCMRPTAYDPEQGGRVDKPSWDELRQQFGGL